MTRAARRAGAAGILLGCALAPAGASAQRIVSGTALVSLVEHRVDIGYGVEESSGLLAGAEGALHLGRRLVLGMRAAWGSLTTEATGAQNRDLGELGIQASVDPAPWLALRSAATWRTYTTPVARQRWTLVEIGAEARLDFASGPVRGVLRGGLLPVVSVKGLPGPDVALTAAAGIEYRSRSLTSGLFYGLERYDFPDMGPGGPQRLEQVSSLTFRFTIQRGLRRA